MNSSDPSRRSKSCPATVQRPEKRRKNLPLALVIAIDILLIGIGLVVFALFHHVLPRDIKTSGQILPTATTASTPMSTQTDPTAETTPAETERGAWGAKFADKFTDGAVEKTASTYKSENINISVSKVRTGDVTYYVADFYLRDLQYLRTAFAGGNYGHGISDEVLDMAIENNAILAITGDYYGIRDHGVVIRNGRLYRENVYEDVLVIGNDGSMETFTGDEFDIEMIKANGAWQAWSFGPMLLDNGQPMTTFNSRVTPRNPRAAIGCFEPGHYCFVLVDGRQPGYSSGMTLTELSGLFHDLGCKTAYNLDGGQSAVMVFLDAWVNRPYRDGRKVSDIIYIGE